MKRATLFLLFAFAAAAPSFAATIYRVSIDTSSLTAGTTGIIDLSFNGGYPGTATIDNFSMIGGGLIPAQLFPPQGTVTGTLPGQVVMGDDNAYYDEGLTFGTSISFQLTLAGTPSGTVGDVFTLSFFNSDFTGGLLTGNVNDMWLAQFQMDTTGSVTATAYANPSGGASFATLSDTPEPGSVALVLAGVFGLCGARFRRRAV